MMLSAIVLRRLSVMCWTKTMGEGNTRCLKTIVYAKGDQGNPWSKKAKLFAEIMAMYAVNTQC